MRTKFWLEILKGRDQSEELGVDGKIILKQDGSVEWINLAQNRDRCQVLFNTFMNYQET
jgi:hypothetical protein